MITKTFQGYDLEAFSISSKEELEKRWKSKGWVWEDRDGFFVAWANEEDRLADGEFDDLRIGWCVSPGYEII